MKRDFEVFAWAAILPVIKRIFYLFIYLINMHAMSTKLVI